MSFCFHTIEIKSCKKNLHKKSHSFPWSYTNMIQTHQDSHGFLKKKKNQESHQVGHWSVNLKSPYLKTGDGWWLMREEEHYLKQTWIENIKATFRASSLVSSAATSDVQQVQEAEFTQRTHAAPSLRFLPMWRTGMMWETAGVSHASFLEYFSNRATGLPIRPQERGGGSRKIGPDQIKPNRSGSNPAPLGS